MRQNEIILSELADIRQGFQLRKGKGSGPRHKDGAVKLIYMADVDEAGTIGFNELTGVDTALDPVHLLKKDDILFCARGHNNYAVRIDRDLTKTVAVNQFLVIRARQDKLRADYLTWYLAQKEAVTYFKANALAGSVPLVNKKTLEQLPVLVLPLELQERIARVGKLVDQEKSICKQITEKKEQLVNAMLLKSIHSQEK